MTIKAIETRYKGYRFRSRLEARWAVFFDALGIEWEYEKEGFDFGVIGRYLPDFWLPQVQMWAEVKPTEPTKMEEEFMRQLAFQSGHSVLMLIGVPEDKSYFAWHWEDISDRDEEFGIPYIFRSEIGGYYKIEYCLTCFHGYPFNEGRFYSSPGGEDDSHFDDTALAAEAARSARFEHGETPRV